MASASPPIQEAFAVVGDLKHPLAKKLPRLIAGFEWLQYFSAQAASIDEKPSRKATVNLSGQGAAITTTPIPLGSIPPGIWRISYIAQITTAAGVSSSLTVTISWTANGLAKSASGAAITGNTTTTVQFGTLIIRVDDSTPISYATAYASDAVGVMRYALDIVAEELALD